eukprot:353864-Chlamydomonas_euryale.AAC.1
MAVSVATEGAGAAAHGHLYSGNCLMWLWSVLPHQCSTAASALQSCLHSLGTKDGVAMWRCAEPAVNVCYALLC